MLAQHKTIEGTVVWWLSLGQQPGLSFSLPFPPYHRKSFEYEDAARLTAKQDTMGGQTKHSGLYHAYSDDNIYEDIVCKSNSLYHVN